MQAQHIPFLNLLNGQVQYVVPRWQRRYRWGKNDIERLVADLMVIAESKRPNAVHYGGNLLTFPEPGPAGVVDTIRVVDGQQRLTTVSILLACIAEKLGPDNTCGEWTADIIHNNRLKNPGMPRPKLYKLRLQRGDEEEYRRVLEGNLEGKPEDSGAVTQAWQIMRRLVASHDTALLLKGLGRLRVVSIGLDPNEDPQQIFESLNATGRPLMESEKIKNWLLIGLSNDVLEEVHDRHWLGIEKALDAEHNTERTDIFFRDFLRWKTGQTSGIRWVYENFRRWAVKSHQDEDRPSLCKELARLANLYGWITGKAGDHPHSGVARNLRHLREMVDVHGSFVLRLLDDTTRARGRVTDTQLAEVLTGVCTWITRMWLADRKTAGRNKAMVELAYSSGPSEDEDVVDYWLGKIRAFRNTRYGVPGDEDVRQGVLTRKAYGAGATRSATAVFCELMEYEHKKENKELPSRKDLTLEHVMPQKLTDGWRADLGDEAEEIHGQYRHRMANLTLSGFNPYLGRKRFKEKKKMYRKSTILLTRRLADERKWNVPAMDRRAEEIARRALERWPWEDEPPNLTKLRWRVENQSWNNEKFAGQMVLNVAAALLNQDPTNADRLFGEAISTNIHKASKYPPNQMVGRLMMREVPNHARYVLYPYGTIQDCMNRSSELAERCNVPITVELVDTWEMRFRKILRENVVNIPGVKWTGSPQWSKPLNAYGDRSTFIVNNPRRIDIYIGAWASGDDDNSNRTARMMEYSNEIRNIMGDQDIDGDAMTRAQEGKSIRIFRQWDGEDEGEWESAVQWIGDQYERLHAIVAGETGEES